ncbi:MAG: hypothetical protein KBA53_10930 [Thermoclostridium sp.]|nr:hypothetical protein [Thermoclostridium sp.]
MKRHVIDLVAVLPEGQAICECKDNCLHMTTTRAIPTQRFDAEHLSINSYIFLPDKYKLPLRVDITAKIDAPGLYVFVGKGHVNFGTLCSDNRRIDDIVSPSRKTIYYHNDIPINEFTDISLIYDLKEMQILVDGQERYHSNNERYMKSREFGELNKEGFGLRIACDKLTNLTIQSIVITEFPDTCSIVHTRAELPAAFTKNQVLEPAEKPTFEKCISRLPVTIQNEIIKLDEYLKSIKRFKFKRQIEKNGNKVTYVASDYGFSYAIYLSNHMFDHSLQWYLITNGKPETWYRKADSMEETLNSLMQKAPDFAQRMFFNLDDCVGCYKNCLAQTAYQLGEKKKVVCHGKLKFNMSPSGFEDVRAFIDEIYAAAGKIPY